MEITASHSIDDALFGPIRTSAVRQRMVKALLVVLSVTLTLSANTLPARLANNLSVVVVTAFLSTIAIIAILWSNTSIERNALATYTVWVTIVVIAFGAVAIANSDRGGNGIATLFFLMILAPLFWYLLLKNDLLSVLCNYYVIIVSFLALASLVLWVLGPVTNIIAPDCTTTTSWGTRNLGKSIPGYHHLLYTVQVNRFWGFPLARNTGIFVEAPMYSYTLCIAMLAEVYGSNKPRIAVIVILAITILTSISSTGYIFLLILFLFNYGRLTTTSASSKHYYLVLAIPIVAVVIVLINLIINQKIDAIEQYTRFDDFVVGIKAWLTSPLYGNGFSNADILHDNMSAFRANDMGFSNSPTRILAAGGIILMIPFLIAFCGLAITGKHGVKIMLLFAFLWTVTIVWTLPITVFVFSLGVSSIMHLSK